MVLTSRANMAEFIQRKIPVMHEKEKTRNYDEKKEPE